MAEEAQADAAHAINKYITLISERDNRMTEAYRFMQTEHLKFWTRDNTIRLGSLAYYRGMEGSGGIGDPNEGSQTRKLSSYRNPGRIDSRTDPILSQLSGILITNSVNCTIEGYTEHVLVPHSLILSTCVGNSIELTHSMCNRPPENYDAGIRIPDLKKLAEAILEGHLENGTKFVSLVKGFRVGAVEYSGTQFSVVANRSIPNPSAFIKDAKFAHQKEARIVFEVSDQTVDTCNVRVPNLNDLFQVIFQKTDGASPSSVPPTQPPG